MNWVKTKNRLPAGKEKIFILLNDEILSVTFHEGLKMFYTKEGMQIPLSAIEYWIKIDLPNRSNTEPSPKGLHLRLYHLKHSLKRSKSSKSKKER